MSMLDTTDNSDNSNNALILASQIDLDAKTAENESNDRTENTKARNRTQSNYFIMFAVAKWPLPDNDARLKFVEKNKFLHKQLLVDGQLANFMTFMAEYHLLKGNLLCPNIRPCHGWICYSMIKNGKSKISYPRLEGCWKGIQNRAEYINSKKGEKAPIFGLEGHVAFIQLSVYDKYGMYCRIRLRSKDCFFSNYKTLLRTENIYKLNEMHVSVDQEDSGKPQVVIKTERQKTRKENQTHVIKCTCDPSHDRFDYQCPVSVAVQHRDMKQMDYGIFIPAKKRENIDYQTLPYFRRIRFCDMKTKEETDIYYSIQRWGEAKVRANIREIAKMANVPPPKTKNKRRIRPTGSVTVF